MAEFSSDEVIDRVRLAMDLDASIDAEAWRVQRIDRENEAYYLIVFEENGAAIIVAAVNALTGGIQNSAHLAEGGSPLSIDSEHAIALAGLNGNAHANLVWRPCRASLSPLYPLWEVRTHSEEVYVDQQGKVWQSLVEAGPGG
jgi:streptogramin lyase